jgi:hypothetical protein
MDESILVSLEARKQGFVMQQLMSRIFHQFRWKFEKLDEKQATS